VDGVSVGAGDAVDLDQVVALVTASDWK